MSLFERLFKAAEAEAHSVADQLENPIKLTEQGIRDLKAGLEQSIAALAEVKAGANRQRNDAEVARSKSEDYERKAMMLVRRAQLGEIPGEQADALASEALALKEQCDAEMRRAQADFVRLDQQTTKLEQQIATLRATIQKYENELNTLRARAQVSDATRRVNKQLANVGEGGTIQMLERMKQKIDTDEATADAYAEIEHQNTATDQEIDSVLANEKPTSGALAALKARMANNQKPLMLGE